MLKYHLCLSPSAKAKLQLLHFEALRERVAGILELKAAENLEEDVAQIMKHLSLVTDSYLVGEQSMQRNAIQDVSKGMPFTQCPRSAKFCMLATT